MRYFLFSNTILNSNIHALAYQAKADAYDCGFSQHIARTNSPTPESDTTLHKFECTCLLAQGGDGAEDGVGLLVLGQRVAECQVEVRKGWQLSEAFGEWRVRPSGTRVVQGEWRMQRSVV